MVELINYHYHIASHYIVAVALVVVFCVVCIISIH